MMRKLTQTVALLVLVVLASAAYFFLQYQRFIQQPVFASGEHEFVIERGQNYSDFVRLIQQRGARGEMWQWKLLARLKDYGGAIRAGEFAVSEPLTPVQLLEVIRSNRVKTYRFTLVEGITWQQLREALSVDPVLRQVVPGMSDAQVLAALDVTHPLPEGLLLPETYQFVRGDSDLDLLKRAHRDLSEALQQAWDERSDRVAVDTPYELLILASIIEKESALESEKGAIAGVFNRRLHKGMRLQTDPTVIYGVGADYRGDITAAHLRTDTPYNTYTRHGLPPTPIAFASRSSIEAAAQPEPGDALYFVANNRGGHTFSDTYEAHLRAVDAYLAGQKQGGAAANSQEGQ